MTQAARHTRLRIVALLAIVVLAAAFVLRGRGGDDGADEHVTTLGQLEVTAELLEIPGLAEWNGDFPDQGYVYAYVMKYRVLEIHRGEPGRETILVAHYNPLKPRGEAADARCEEIGGNVTRFRAGDVHRMALGIPIDEYDMAPMINKYYGRADEGPLHWAIWTNRVVR